MLYFTEVKSLGIVVGDFRIDWCNQSRLSHLLVEYTQTVKSPRHIAGSMLDHIYVKDCYLEDRIIEVSLLNTSFTDHDAVWCAISKNEIDFTIL